jgi:hypothetical protein
VNKLDRVDEHDRRLRTPRLLDDARDIRLAEHEQPLAERRSTPRLHHGLEPFGAQAHLLRAFLARRVERGAAARRDRCSGLHEERALADAGVAADQEHRTRDHAAAEHPVELADAGRDARNRRLRHAAKGDGAAELGVAGNSAR